MLARNLKILMGRVKLHCSTRSCKHTIYQVTYSFSGCSWTRAVFKQLSADDKAANKEVEGSGNMAKERHCDDEVRAKIAK